MAVEFTPGSNFASMRPSSDQRLYPAPLRVIFMPNSVDLESSYERNAQRGGSQKQTAERQRVQRTHFLCA